MKFCHCCKQSKLKSDFNKSSYKKDGLQTQCRECTRKSHNKAYAENKHGIREKRSLQNAKTSKYNRVFIQKYKKLCGCKLCGFKVPVALDFHHLDPNEKDMNVSDLVHFSIKKLKEEIRKCIVLCANCHMMVHAGLLEIV